MPPAASALKTTCFSLLRATANSNPPATFLLWKPKTYRPFPAGCPFSTTSTAFSGHSRWSKIKHDKGKNDSRRGAEFSKISWEIITAAKVDGEGSHRLKAALELGKKAGMTKAAMENAVRRGLGTSAEGVELQVIVVEAIGPGNVSIIVDCLTDNKLRTMQLIRYLLQRNGATITPTAYLFSRKGRIFLALRTGLPEPQPTLPDVFEETFEKAMDIEGVEDVELVDEAAVANVAHDNLGISVTTVPEMAKAVSKELVAQMGEKLKVEKLGVEWVANEDTMVEVGEGDEACRLGDLIDKLQESDDVQEVYTNAKH